MMTIGGVQIPPTRTEFPQHLPGEAAASDLVVGYLDQLGIEYVFGVPGGAIEPLYSALARSARRGGPRPVVARHESGAAFMADGYTRATGKLGVCCATTGPGATNLITGVACAYENEIPMLVISAQTALPTFGRAALQESSCTGINTVGMFQYCTRYNTLISHVDQLEHKLVSAILRAHHPTPGPVHLSIPLDVFQSMRATGTPAYDVRALLKQPALLDIVAVEELYRQISVAQKAVLLIGAGCGEAIGLITEFAMLLNIPFITTPQAKGLVSATHPLNKGVFGFAGHLSANVALREDAAELIVAAGTTFGEFASGAWSDLLLNNRLIHVDQTEEHLTRSPMARLHVRGRLVTVFEALIKMHHDANFPGTRRLERSPEERRAGSTPLVPDSATTAFNPADWHPNFPLAELQKYNSDDTPIRPQRLMHELSRLFPPTTMFLADPGNSMAWATHYLHPLDRRQSSRRLAAAGETRLAGRRSSHGGRVQTVMDFAPMGWSIGSAIGTALGRPGHPVVCITGDGSFLMSGQEITVAVAEKLTVIFVILNDAALGMVKHGQRLRGAERVAYELPAVDFCAMANAMGAAAHAIRSPADMLSLDFRAICERPGPTLLDVYIDPEEIPPIGMRVKVLEATK
jgi:acetolactate synthase I/II/III large subunit